MYDLLFIASRIQFVKIQSSIRRHLSDPDSHHRRIAVGFLKVSFFVLIGKFVSATKEMAIAWHYGVSETVDAYIFVFNTINWPISVWFSVLTVVLLPLAARVRNENSADLPRFRGELLGLTLSGGLLFGGMAYIALPVLLRTGFSGHALQQTLSMAAPLVLLLPMGFVISLFSAWMMACGRHRNTMLESLPALVILAALLMPFSWLSEPLVWGSIVGFALQMTALSWPLRRAGELQRPLLGFQSSAWQGFWRSFSIMAAGQTLMSFTGIIDQFFAAHLGAGAISTLSYANRIVALILSLGATAVSRSTLPIFSELSSGKGKTTEIRVLALRWAKLMFLLGLVAMFVVWLLAPWMVKLLFQRGAFTNENTMAVSEVIRYLAPQLPFYFAGIVLVSLLSSQLKYKEIQIVACLNLFTKIVAMRLLMPMGVHGIALATSIMYLASLVMLAAMTLKKI